MTEVRKAPDRTGSGRVDFKPNLFDALVFDKGQKVIWESALVCPCKLDGRGHIGTCINCGGIGYVFINPVETRMVMQSMNQSTKTAQWSLEKIGITNITTRSIDVLGDMDRITVLGTKSKISQVVRPKFYKHKYFSFVNYGIINILDVFQFVAPG